MTPEILAGFVQNAFRIIEDKNSEPACTINAAHDLITKQIEFFRLYEKQLGFSK